MTRRALVGELEGALEQLVAINVRVLASRQVPPIARAGVTYEAETVETWRTIPVLLELGKGDAEDLACWRAADLRMQGTHARVVVLERGDGALSVVVRTAAGDEDPTLLVPNAAASSRGRK